MLKRAEQAAVHKFRVGQEVEVIPLRPDQVMLAGPFVVTEQFRHQGELLYCVKSPHEPYERVLTESRLCVVDAEPVKIAAPFAMEERRNPR